MFDEQQAEDEDLEDIIEQPIEEESGEGDSEEEMLEDGQVTEGTVQQHLADSKAQRMMSKEELMKLRT